MLCIINSYITMRTSYNRKPDKTEGPRAKMGKVSFKQSREQDKNNPTKKNNPDDLTSTFLFVTLVLIGQSRNFHGIKSTFDDVRELRKRKLLFRISECPC